MNRNLLRCFVPGLIGFLLTVSGCRPAGGDNPGLLLSGAFFEDSKPVPARLLIARYQGGEEDPWKIEVLDAGDGSNVFHKSMVFHPVSGPAGILTISGSRAPAPAFVKFWTKNGDKWEAKELYQGQFGGKFDRCRDMEVADVNGDGVEEILVVTHQRGVVIVIEQKGGEFVPTEIAGFRDSEEEVWIHEVEVGDVDGDGINEFFTTPSAPNNLDGEEQPGRINMYSFEDGEYKETLVEEFTTRHVKEILCYDFEGNGTPCLFASIEGEAIGGVGGASSQVKLYRWENDAFEGEIIMDLPGKLCRFLSCADTDGDGQIEIIASTAKNGIHSIYRQDGIWKKRSIAPSSVSSGFEHATVPLDWDGDGRDEIFAVSDEDKTLRRFYYDDVKGRYKSERLHEFDAESLFIFNIEPLPSGM